MVFRGSFRSPKNLLVIGPMVNVNLMCFCELVSGEHHAANDCAELVDLCRHLQLPSSTTSAVKRLLMVLYSLGVVEVCSLIWQAVLTVDIRAPDRSHLGRSILVKFLAMILVISCVTRYYPCACSWLFIDSSLMLVPFHPSITHHHRWCLACHATTHCSPNVSMSGVIFESTELGLLQVLIHSWQHLSEWVSCRVPTHPWKYLKVLEFFSPKFKALKVLENRTGAWKFLNSTIQTTWCQQLC